MKIINFVFNDFTNDIRVLKESASLKKSGFDIVVAGTFQKGLKKKDKIKGISVIRIKVNYLRLMPPELIIFWIKSVIKFRKEKIFHCNDLYTLPIAVFIKLFLNKKVKIVYDCHEYETEAHVYIKRPVLKLMSKIFEKVLIKYADSVVTVSNSIAMEYKKIYKIKKPTLILNCPYFISYKTKKDLFREKFKIPKETKIVLYQGEYKEGRGLETIIKVFNNLKDLKIVIVFLGYGNYFNKLTKRIKNTKNIFVHKKVDGDIYMDYVASADYGIHLMENSCLNHQYALPNKLFEYIMVGLPVIVSDLSEMKKLVEENNIGVVIKKNNSEELIKGLEKMTRLNLENTKKKLSNLAKIYNWENQEKILIETYNQLVKN